MASIPTADQINEAEKKASAVAADYVSSDSYFNTLKEIVNVQKLHIDEIGNIGDALDATFYELRTIEEFPALLREALEQNKDKYDAVLKDINEKIFKPYREHILNEKKQPEIAQPSVAPEKIRAQTPSEEIAPAKLLEQKVSQPSQTVSVDAFSEDTEIKTEQKYKGVDPYREPVE